MVARAWRVMVVAVEGRGLGGGRSMREGAGPAAGGRGGSSIPPPLFVVSPLLHGCPLPWAAATATATAALLPALLRCSFSQSWRSEDPFLSFFALTPFTLVMSFPLSPSFSPAKEDAEKEAHR